MNGEVIGAPAVPLASGLTVFLRHPSSPRVPRPPGPRSLHGSVPPDRKERRRAGYNSMTVSWPLIL